MVESRFVLIITSVVAVGRSRTAGVKRGDTYVPVAGRAATRPLIAPRRGDYLLMPRGRVKAGNCLRTAQWSACPSTRPMGRAL